MTQSLSADAAAMSIGLVADALGDDIDNVVEQLGYLASNLTRGVPVGAAARVIAEQMVRLTEQAARLDGMREIAALYNTPR